MIAMLMLSALVTRSVCVEQCIPTMIALCQTAQPERRLLHCQRVRLRKLVRQCRHHKDVCPTTTTTTSSTTTYTTTTFANPCAHGCNTNCTCTTTTTIPPDPCFELVDAVQKLDCCCMHPNEGSCQDEFIGSPDVLCGSPSGAFP